jgi:transcriptional regulator with XRE-family HTH domain
MGTLLGRHLQTIGGRIFLVRIRNGLTQGDFAHYLGVSRQDITDYEHGSEVPPHVLVTLCEVFSVEWLWLTVGNGLPYFPSAFSVSRNNAMLS